MENVSAVILDGKIIAVIVADTGKDSIPLGYPSGSIFIDAPQGCSEDWTYDPVTGFKPPAVPFETANKMDF